MFKHPTWILETNVFSEACFDRMVAHFEAHAIPYETVRVVPFAHTVQGPTPKVSGPVVCYGSLGIQKVAKEAGWYPGVWFDEERFSTTAYKALGNLFLNNDAIVMKMSEVYNYLDWAKLTDVFLKPNGDLKQFAGQTMYRDDFKAWHDKMVSIGYLEEDDFEVVIAPIKELGREYRCVVVDSEIVATSRVRPTAVQENLPPEAEIAVGLAITLYEPAPIYVIDVCEVFVDGNVYWQIIEYNNFNSAGFYECDVANIIEAVTDYFHTLVDFAELAATKTLQAGAERRRAMKIEAADLRALADLEEQLGDHEQAESIREQAQRLDDYVG